MVACIILNAVFLPSSPSFSVYASTPDPGDASVTATSSNAEKTVETATSSEALYDEDGLLLDGNVSNDLLEEELAETVEVELSVLGNAPAMETAPRSSTSVSGIWGT